MSADLLQYSSIYVADGTSDNTRWGSVMCYGPLGPNEFEEAGITQLHKDPAIAPIGQTLKNRKQN